MSTRVHSRRQNLACASHGADLSRVSSMSVVPEVATTPSPPSPKRRTGYRVWGEVSLALLFIWGASLLAVRIGERQWIAERHDAGTNGAPVQGAAGWQASDGPSPIFGLRWLMTAAELKAERPGLEE